MTGFLAAVAALIATALVFVLPPLLRRDASRHADFQRADVNLTVMRDQLDELRNDLANGVIEQDAFERARRDLERRVAEEVRTTEATPASVKRGPVAIAVAFSVPLIAMALYFFLGSPLALDPLERGAVGSAHDVAPMDMERMVAGLAERLKSQPDDEDGWHMLARSYNALGKYRQASEAYAQLTRLSPQDAQLLADYADTLAMAQNQSLQGEPEKLINQALAIEPNNIKALALSGSAAFERRDYAKAVDAWQRIMALAPPESDIARSTAGSIGEAKKLLGQAPAPASSQPGQDAKVNAATQVAGVVEIDPALRSQLAESDTVFIFARAVEGSRMPLAVLRKQVKDLPLQFVLDDSMRMTPERSLANASMVVVGARISRTGSATDENNAPQAVTEPVKLGTTNLKIRLTAK